MSRHTYGRACQRRWRSICKSWYVYCDHTYVMCVSVSGWIPWRTGRRSTAGFGWSLPAWAAWWDELLWTASGSSSWWSYSTQQREKTVSFTKHTTPAQPPSTKHKSQKQQREEESTKREREREERGEGEKHNLLQTKWLLVDTSTNEGKTEKKSKDKEKMKEGGKREEIKEIIIQRV